MNFNDFATEIATREKRKGADLNITHIKAVLRHAFDIAKEKPLEFLALLAKECYKRCKK
jgi:hypothetical protein